MPKRKCVLCQKSKDSSQCRSLSSCSYGWYHEYLKEKGTSFDDNDLFLCSSCVYDFYKPKASCIKSDIPVTTDSSNIEPMDTTTIEDDHDLALNNVIYGGSSQNHCIICRQERDHLSDMITVPKPARLDLLIIHKLYVPHGVRCCANTCCLLADLILKRLSIWTIGNNSRLLFLLKSSLTSLAIYSLLLKKRFDLLVSIFVIHHCRAKTLKHGPDGKRISLSAC